MDKKKAKKQINTIFFRLTDGARSFSTQHPFLTLSLAVLLTAVAVFSRFLFFGETFVYGDIGGDTKDVYYPFFASLSRKLQEGDFSMWSFEYGLGTNIITRQADIGSPFTWLIILGNEAWIRYGLVITHILKMLLSSLFCYLYLGSFRFSEHTKILASFVYAFNGFTVLWGQHYFFGTAALHIVLVLAAMEKVFLSMRYCPFFAFAVFAVMVNSYYYAYMVLLTAAVYGLFRLWYLYSFREWRICLTRIAQLFASVLLGGAMSAVLFLPAVKSVIGTSARLGMEQSVFQRLFDAQPYSKDGLITIVARLFSNNLEGTDDYSGYINYYEAPQFFFTSFLLFFLILFLLQLPGSQKTTKQKLICVGATGLCLFLCFHPMLSIVLNGFVAPFFRYTFLLMPILALLTATVLEKILKGQLRHAEASLFLACLLSLVPLAVSYFFRPSQSLSARFFVLTIPLMTVCLSFFSQMLHRKSRLQRRGAALLLALLIGVNVGLESLVTTTDRTFIGEVDENFSEPGGNAQVAEAVAYIHSIDDGFFRTDKLFLDISLFNDSMLQGYYPVSTYNSVINRNVLDFIHCFYPEFAARGDGYNFYGAVFEDETFSSLFGVKYIISDWDISHIAHYKLLKTFGDVFVFENTKCDGIPRFYTKTAKAEDFSSRDSQKERSLLADTLLLEGELGEADGSEAEVTLSFDRPDSESLVSGSIVTDRDGYLFLSIPFEDGWSALIDGKETPLLKADIGFLAVPISEGEHRVEFRYETPLLRTGAWISAVGFTGFFLWLAFIYINQKKGVCK